MIPFSFLPRATLPATAGLLVALYACTPDAGREGGEAADLPHRSAPSTEACGIGIPDSVRLSEEEAWAVSQVKQHCGTAARAFITCLAREERRDIGGGCLHFHGMGLQLPWPRPTAPDDSVLSSFHQWIIAGTLPGPTAAYLAAADDGVWVELPDSGGMLVNGAAAPDSVQPSLVRDIFARRPPPTRALFLRVGAGRNRWDAAALLDSADAAGVRVFSAEKMDSLSPRVPLTRAP